MRTFQMSRRIAAEYSDEVSKLNKKEDLLLQRKLKVFDKQEKAAETSHKRSLQNVQQFKFSLENDKKTPNLKDIERQHELSIKRQYGGLPIGRSLPTKPSLIAKGRGNPQENPAGRAVRLPPLFNLGTKGKNLKQTFAQPPVTLLKSPRFKATNSRVPDYSMQLKKLEEIVKAIENKQNPLGLNKLLTSKIPPVRPLDETKGGIRIGEASDGTVEPPGVEELQPGLPEREDSMAMTEEWVDASVKVQNTETATYTNRNSPIRVLASKDDILSGRQGAHVADRSNGSGFVKNGDVIVIRPHSANTCCTKKADVTGSV